MLFRRSTENEWNSYIQEFHECPCYNILISERSEPLSRVFNDQPHYIYIYMVESVRTYVSNAHAHVRMSVCY